MRMTRLAAAAVLLLVVLPLGVWVWAQNQRIDALQERASEDQPGVVADVPGEQDRALARRDVDARSWLLVLDGFDGATTIRSAAET